MVVVVTKKISELRINGGSNKFFEIISVCHKGEDPFIYFYYKIKSIYIDYMDNQTTPFSDRGSILSLIMMNKGTELLFKVFQNWIVVVASE